MQLLNGSNQLGHIIKARRKALGLTQQALASRLAITQNRLSQIEAAPGSLTFDRLVDLLNILGLDLMVQDRKPGKKADW
ncbi:MAG TPA: helix-turn-helix domain-containing protein [Burkholderiales bacterium]|nr:helix-turn-helix domain-containing protein [Burkholderiales bacterium]